MPVGVSATKYRNERIKELLQYKVAVIKGNASEIAKTAGIDITTKGVDSGNVLGNMVKIAKTLAYEKKSVVAATGKEDICTDRTKVFIVKKWVSYDVAGYRNGMYGEFCHRDVLRR